MIKELIHMKMLDKWLDILQVQGIIITMAINTSLPKTFHILGFLSIDLNKKYAS